MKLLVIDDNKELVDLIEKHFIKSNNVKVTLKAYCGEEGIKIATDNVNDYDCIILDLVMPNKDGLYVLSKLKELNINKKVIVSTSFNNDNIVSMISNYQINYILIKPYDIEDLENIILNIDSKSKNTNFNKSLINILHELGIPSNIKGYEYIKQSIIEIYSNPSIMNKITKDLYPCIANKYNTTTSRVEGAIRHAIEISFRRGNIDTIHEIFGHSIDIDKSKPTNSSFISTIAEKLRLKYKHY
jgi:two-component system response regulator (stage 0 sporulation protein A)